MRKRILFFLLLLPAIVRSQTLNDGLMMPQKNFCTGFIYTYDKWDEYWEGRLRRDNGNIGSITTQSLMWVGNYGITSRLNVIAMVPYVRAEASQGTLQSTEGFQDLTLAVKYNVLRKDVFSGSLRLFAAAGFSTPLTDYTPDYFPLSLGTGTTNIFYRGTAFYKKDIFFLNVSGAYTWRGNATLDRPSYYTNDRLYLTNEVEMPNVFDYNVNIGILNRGFQAELFINQQVTLGGSDIRRQDMPFVSNKMNATRVGALVMYYVPYLKGLALRGSVSKVIDGRNAGISTNFLAGILYTIPFGNTEEKE